MKALVRGQRVGSIAQVLTLVAVCAVAVPLLTLVYFSRSDARTARAQTERVRATLYDLQASVYARCQAREGFDASQLGFDRALQAYYDDLLPNIRRNAPDNAFYRRLTGKVVRIERGADILFGTGAPVGCEQYRPDPRLAP